MSRNVATKLPDFPSQGIIQDRAGLDVDASGWEWRLNNLSRNKILNFDRLRSLPDLVFDAVVLHLADRIKLTSPDNVRNAFGALRFLTQSEALAGEVAAGADISSSFFAELRMINNFSVWRLHHIRFWYRWCANRHLPHFSRETADLLDDLVIGGNEKGRAVRTRDPEKGAFDDIEFGAILTRLRALGPEVLSLTERVLVWLQVAFGRNAFAYAKMREEDYRPLKEVATGRIYHRFDVPQVKKGHDYLRSGSDPKELNQELGTLVAELVAENASVRRDSGWPEGCGYPLFRRREPQPDLLGGQLHEFAMHMTSAEITATVERALRKLEVISHRTGELVRGNSRRFRYTYGTRLAEEGASPSQLATGLGHSDLQHVGVYYETRPNQVDRLDAALAVELGPIADAFMGRIVSEEGEAVNGTDPAKRIPFFRRKFGEKPQLAGELGVCGAGPCGRLAPVSCYTCERFQPWRDGPHREMLDWLVEERERQMQAGLDPQIYKIHDVTIMAIGKVVAACEEKDA
ncbi:tyrosine-type recombinase/integrase [Bradyrhizobium daqingense]|uniref:Phage integrase family protein n=1 Tax=Bradyrhizobium daqingense TaxID=993502 RepID=A0A562KWN7_9BRAD|nr:tyrosine-type recombinase/integrase [Bradyrhizobium daqingense]TWH99784.1 phage integrase family protein [Bradyrhizobium daqingense]UFS86966.1 tyrosine-type recombinase/integrase [Bradyrhizobium daqingense]